MASDAEAKYGAIFLNRQEAIPIQTTLIDMNHTSLPPPCRSTIPHLLRLANCSTNQKRSKAMDMHFHLIQDWILKKQVNAYWQPVPTNLGDYHSKNNHVAHHQQVLPTNLH